MGNENLPKPPEVKEQSYSERLSALFNKAVETIKSSADARKEIDPDKDLVTMDDKTKEKFEVPKVSWEKAFDLGKFGITQADVKKIPAIDEEKVYLLLGSVDRTTFNKKIKKEAKEIDRYEDGTKVKWYKALQEDADLFIKIKDNIETNFPQLADPAKKGKMIEIITEMSKMADFTDVAWKKMITDKGYTDAEIYGAEGAYNLMLSFQRAIAPIDREDLLNPKDVTISLDQDQKAIMARKYTVRLEVASKKGKRASDRFSKLVEVKVKGGEKKEEKKDGKTVEKGTQGEPPAPVEPPSPVEPPQKILIDPPAPVEPPESPTKTTY